MKNATTTKTLCSAAALAALLLAGCAGTMTAGDGWTTLIDGDKGLANFDVVGQANWSGSDGAVQASAGTPPASFIVTRTSYKDVMVRAEFWSSSNNPG